MKSAVVFCFIFIIFTGCNLFDFDHSRDFPDCVGTEEPFSLDLIKYGYIGKIWNADTIINTPFVFAEYQFDSYLLRRTYKMYIRIKTSPTRTDYPAMLCFRHWETKEWMTDGAFDFNGHYTTWNFYFDEFDCSSLAGSCMVIRPHISDTIYYQFEGSR